jgi:hypothetical protein
MNSNSISILANALITAFEENENNNNEKKIGVNILVSKVASWYERVRTAMDYGSEETILRRAIERILKRRLLLFPNPKSIAEDLVRELIWAGYFKNLSLPESITQKVAEKIELYLDLKEIVLKQKEANDDTYDILIQLLSCEINTILLPNPQKEAMSNFMFQTLKNSVEILDDTKQTRDVQVFIAVRKNFAKDDLPFLRFKLFTQIFGKLSNQNFDNVQKNFFVGLKEINYQLAYPKKDRIFNHIKTITPAFLILYDLLREEKSNVKNLVLNQEAFRSKVFSICERRYKNISKKVQTAIIRSFVFILVTKALIALLIEGTFEKIFLGTISWTTIGINTIFPPFLMIFTSLFIKTPDAKNSEAIFVNLKRLLVENNPNILEVIYLKLKKDTGVTIKDRFFYFFWLLSILLIFGTIVAILNKLHFNLLSQAIFLFFVAIVSFLSYRIYQTAYTYTVLIKSNLFSPIFDFFFVPILRVGRNLTEGIAQINFVLIIIDFIIETPFKGLVGFFEQWFSYLAAKKEELE